MRTFSEYKRRHQRITGPFLVRFLTYNYKRLDSQYCICAEGIDISPNGLSFKYPRVMGRNDHLRVLIQDVDGLKSEEIIANVRIVWGETKDVLSKRFGGKFVKITPEKKYKLMRLIRNNGGG